MFTNICMWLSRVKELVTAVHRCKNWQTLFAENQCLRLRYIYIYIYIRVIEKVLSLTQIVDLCTPFTYTGINIKVWICFPIFISGSVLLQQKYSAMPLFSQGLELFEIPLCVCIYIYKNKQNQVIHWSIRYIEHHAGLCISNIRAVAFTQQFSNLLSNMWQVVLSCRVLVVGSNFWFDIFGEMDSSSPPRTFVQREHKLLRLVDSIF